MEVETLALYVEPDLASIQAQV